MCEKITFETVSTQKHDELVEFENLFIKQFGADKFREITNHLWEIYILLHKGEGAFEQFAINHMAMYMHGKDC